MNTQNIKINCRRPAVFDLLWFDGDISMFCFFPTIEHVYSSVHQELERALVPERHSEYDLQKIFSENSEINSGEKTQFLPEKASAQDYGWQLARQKSNAYNRKQPVFLY